MLKAKLERRADFYLGETATNFVNQDLVNDQARNPELGIEHIGLMVPETKKSGAPIFKLTLRLTNGIAIYGDIFVNKDGRTLNVRYPQDVSADAQGNRTYFDKVSVPLAITAQVLRHASTMVEYVETPVQQAPAQQAPVPPAVPAAQAVAQPAPAEQQVDISNMSPEALQQLVNQFAVR